MSTQLYDLSDLRRRGIRFSRSTMARMEAEGRFPKRVRFSRYLIAWMADEIDDYIAALADQRGAR